MSEDKKDLPQEVVSNGDVATPAQEERVAPKDWSNDLDQSLKMFKLNGLPGISRIKDDQVLRMHEMYLAGASYKEIGHVFKVKPVMVVFHSEREGWYKEKIERAEAIAETLSQSYNYIRAKGTMFFTEMISMWMDYYERQYHQYQITKDPRIVETMDLRPLEKFVKMWEALHKTVTPPKDPTAQPNLPNPHPFPRINVELPNGGDITQTKDGIRVSPTDTSNTDTSKILEAMAMLKRAAELEQTKKK